MNQEDAEKLSELWTLSQPEVAAFIRTLVRDRDHAQDLLQQVAVKLVRNFHQYDSSRPFTPWAIGIARYEVLVWRRALANDRHLFDEPLLARLAAVFERTSVRRSESLEALDHCVEAVSDRGRRVLDLYYGQDLKVAEVAKQMETSSGSIKTLLSRTREALRRCIERRLAAGEQRS